jgi:hypothetical protein
MKNAAIRGLRNLMQPTRTKLTVAIIIWIASVAFVLSLPLDRVSLERNVGIGVANFIHGECDLRFRDIVRRDRSNIEPGAVISSRFLNSRFTQRIFPILKDEETHLVWALERASAWDSGGVSFQLYKRGNGNVSFHPQAPLDQFELDECGYLEGDDYPARLRQAAHLLERAAKNSN